MGKSVVLNDIDDTYVITVVQYSNKGIIFILTDKISKKEVDRFIWEYPQSWSLQLGKGEIKRLK